MKSNLGWLTEAGRSRHVAGMATVATNSGKVDGRLWKADDFLDWLQPGIFADLIHGFEILTGAPRIHADASTTSLTTGLSPGCCLSV